MTSLAAATNLRDLRKAAAGLPGLAEPVSALRYLASPSLRFKLEAIEQAGVGTVGELLASAGQLRITRWDRDEILDVIRAFLEGGPGPGEAPAEPEALRTWAERAGVTDALAWPVRVLDGLEQPRVLRSLAGDLASVACPAVGELARHPQPPIRLAGAAAARSFLELVARHRRERLLRERRLLELPPPSPRLALVAGRLERLRASSRPGLELPLAEELGVVGDPPALVFRAQILEPPLGRRRVTVTLPLDGAAPTCTCRPASRTGRAPGEGEDPGPCAHLHAAATFAICALRDPAHAGLQERASVLVNEPAWRRALLDLARAAHEGEPGQRLALRVSAPEDPEDPLTPATVSPVVQKRKGDGWTLGTTFKGPIYQDGEIAFIDVYDELSQDGYLYRVAPGPSARALLAMREAAGPVLRTRGPEAVEVRDAALELTAIHRDGGLALAPTVEGDEVDVHLPPRAGLVAYPSRDGAAVRLVRVSPALRRLLSSLARHPVRVPLDAASDLAGAAQELAPVLPVRLPDRLKGQRVEPRADVVLRLLPSGVTLTGQVLARPLPGGAPVVPGAGPPEVVAPVEGGGLVHAVRDLDAELAVAHALRERLELPGLDFLLRGEDALALVARLEELGDVSVEWPATRWTSLGRASASQLKVRAAKQRDWFGLEGGLDVGPSRIELALLLDAAREGRRFVEVKPGSFLELEERLRAALARLADHAGEGLQIDASAALALDALSQEGAHVDAGAELADVLWRLHAARDHVPVVPAALTAELRPYQVEGFRFLSRLAAWGAGACLADDMGLGKTVQALALLVDRAGKGPSLVVAPTSVAGNWIREAQRFAPTLTLHLHAERRVDPFALGPGDVLVTTWSLLARDEDLSRVAFATAVFDEAQALKNPASQRAGAARALRAEFKVALTGTPVENHLGELWSLLRVIVPGLLGSEQHFRARFALPIERNGDVRRRESLARLVRPFLLRRTKAEVAPELPARTEVVVPVSLSDDERRLYDDARLAAVARLTGLAEQEEKRRFEALAALTRLRLCACHPRLYDERSQLPSSKLERLLELVDELREEGHRALVFSQFTSHLALVREALDAAGVRYLYLDGETPAGLRTGLVDAFQSGEGELFLISLKAGGTGLNLTAATYVIHLDPWWNPAAEDQATDRAHRIGQERPVTVMRLVAQDTIEEKILELHADKRELADAILAGTGAAARMSAGEMLRLIEG